MADTVFEYFKSQLGRIPQDVTLRNLPNESGCGMDCCRVIDCARALLAFTDPMVHADIVDAVEHDISIKWHG